MTEHEYEHVTVESLPDAPNPTRHKKEIDEAVGTSEFGFNLIVADAGESVPWGYHYHPNHEELFYVLDGTLRIETPDGIHTVESGEAFFTPAGAPQKAVAGTDGCRLVAAGAPKDRDSAVIEEKCPECGQSTDRDYRIEGDSYVLVCAGCGTDVDELTPGPDG